MVISVNIIQLNQKDSNLNNCRPNFFVIGAAKAGTSTICKLLELHPKVFFSPIKEPNHFCEDIDPNKFSKRIRSLYFLDKNFFSEEKKHKQHAAFIQSRSDYLSLFNGADGFTAVGEGSVSYLFSTHAAAAMHRFNPNAKIIVILRDPVSRAFSHYKMDKMLGLQDNSFEKAIENDFNVLEKGWGVSHLYIELGLYSKQLERFMRYFQGDQIKIVWYDDFLVSPGCVMREIFDFLKVEQINISADGRKENISRAPRFPIAHRGLRNVYDFFYLKKFFGSKINKLVKDVVFKKNNEELTEKQKKFMLQFFLTDIQELEVMCKRDLSNWKQSNVVKNCEY